MAKRKTTAAPTRGYSTYVWMLLTAISGGGIGGHFNPEWPVVGPLMQRIYAIVSTSTPENPATLQDIAEAFREETAIASGDLRSFPAGYPPNPYAPGGQGGVSPVNTTQLASSRRPPDRILIATFNIQVFGQSKLEKPEVVRVLADVVRQFDIVAIQEVRAKSDDILPRFLAAINADGSRYDFIIGPRIGRTVSTEQYAYVFDTTRVEYNPQQVGTLSDPEDRLHREPYVARFRAKSQSPAQAFTFWLVAIHTDPDEVRSEVDALADVFRLMQSATSDEDDVILLGDLNASESQMGTLGRLPGISWVVSGAMTNTRKNKAYDNIIFARPQTSEYTGRWGVFDLTEVYGLSQEQALTVSDHFPVWAEFSVWETPPNQRFTQTATPPIR